MSFIYLAKFEVSLLYVLFRTVGLMMIYFHVYRLVLRIMIDSEYKGNQDFSSKYGCHPLDVPTVLETAKELNLNVVGVR
jgi:hypothetical protein